MEIQHERDAATRASEGMRASLPHALSACYDRASDRVVVELSSGFSLSFPRQRAEGIEHASAAELEEVEISPSGFGVRFPAVDADLWVPAMLQGVFGTARWEAEWAATHGANKAA
jgi:hypothetical protein